MKKLFAVFCSILLVLGTAVPALAAEGEPVITFETSPYIGARKCIYTFPNGGVLYLRERTEGIRTPEGTFEDKVADYWTLYDSENLQGDVIIPDYIDGKPVEELFFQSDRTNISDCLAGNPEMVSVTFPSTLKTVKGSINLSPTSEWILSRCPKLESVVFLGDGPEDLGRGFFPANSHLKYVKLPKNISNMDDLFAAYSFNSLRVLSVQSVDKIDLDPENEHFTMDGQGIIYTADKTKVVTAMQGAAERRSASLPDSVTEIGDCAFSGNGKLERITGGAAGMKAAENTFIGCTALNPFQDTYGHWGEESVKWAYDEGLLQGTGTFTFSPEALLNRGMACTALYRLAEGNTESTADPFPDVSYEAYYGPAVSWAEEENLVLGYADGRFHPEDPVTREQLAAILYRYALSKGIHGEWGTLDAFADADTVSAYAQDAMRWAVGSGLFHGKGGSRLDPQGLASRAEAAAIMERMAELS